MATLWPTLSRLWFLACICAVFASVEIDWRHPFIGGLGVGFAAMWVAKRLEVEAP